MRKLLTLAALPALVLALGLAGCGDDDSDDDSASGDDTSSTAEDTTSSSSAGEDGAGETVELVATDFEFEPSTLEAPAGTTVTVAVRNEGDAPHTFTSDDLGVDEEVEPGGSTEVEVTVPDSGEVPFECRFHGSGGMTGTLVAA